MKVVKIVVLTLTVLAVVGLAGAYTIQTANKGSAQLMLEGGRSGPVPFPHLVHQETLGDCSICHELFPQQAGAIERLKATGELKQKQVMNKQCTKCHKQFKKEGKQTGPTTCKSCHVED
jgi:cytochrome c553